MSGNRTLSKGASPNAWTEFGYRFLLFLIVALFYWKLVLTRQFDWIWGPDMAQQILPWFAEEARQLQHSRIPLWDTHSWAGQPLPGQAQPGAVYPLNWLLWLVPRHHDHIAKWALQWYYVVIHYMAALFCYVLCRDIGRGRAASLAAGLMFGVSGYIGRTDWPQMLNGAVWAPLIIMFILRAARGVRPLASAAFAGLCLGLSWLSGHHEAPIYLTLASGALWLYYFFKNGIPDWRIARLAALAFLVMLLVGAVQILPAQEYGRLALRWAPSALRWDQAVPYSSDRDQALYGWPLFGLVFPGIHRNSDPFIGVVALALLIIAIAAAWKQPLVKVFAALALGGLVYTFGHQSVFHGIIYAVIPWVEKARVPSRALLICHVGTAVLAAYGIDYFLSGADQWMRRIITGVAAFGILTFTIVFGAMATKKLSWDTDDRLVLTAFVAVLFAALLYAWRTHNLSTRTAQVLLLLLVLQELGNSSGYTLAERATKDHFTETSTGYPDIAAFLHSRPGMFRCDSATDDLVGNWGDYYNLDFLHSYLASATASAFRLEQNWEAQMLYGVRYTLSPKPVHDGQVDVFTGQSGIKVYENPDAFPRAWTVHEIVTIASPKEGLIMVNEHLQEMHRQAFMTVPGPKLEKCDGQDTVSFLEYKPSRVTIRAGMACQGMLVLSDTFYPGWYASIDGKPAEIHEVNFAMRGVVVPRGTHDVLFRYRPPSVIVGAVLTLAGVLAVVVLAFIDRR